MSLSWDVELQKLFLGGDRMERGCKGLDAKGFLFVCFSLVVLVCVCVGGECVYVRVCVCV